MDHEHSASLDDPQHGVGELQRADVPAAAMRGSDVGGAVESAAGADAGPARQFTSAAARSAFLSEASRILSESLDYESVLQRVADAAVPDLADWCVAHIIGATGTSAWPPAVRRVAIAGQNAAKLSWARKIGERVQRDWASPSGLPHVLRTGQSAFFPVITEELLRSAPLSPQERAAFRRIGLRSAMCVPLTAHGRTFGALSFGMAESGRRYEPADLELAVQLARRAAVAIDNARLYADERTARLAAERAARRLERLQAATAALSHALTPREVADVVVHHGLEALGAKAAAVAVASDGGQSLEVLAIAGYAQAIADRFRTIPMDLPFPLTDVVREGAPIYLASELEREARYPTLAEVRRHNGPGAMAALPLVVDGRAIGAIGFNFPSDQPLSGDDRTFLEALAHQCAQALDRARLYEAELRAKEAVDAVHGQLRFLAEASKLLSSSLEYEATVANIAKLAVPALASSCVIDLVGAGGRLERVAAVFETEELTQAVDAMRRRNPLTAERRHPALRVLTTGESIFVPVITPESLPEVVDDDPDSLALARRLDPTSCVFVALKARGRTLGVMSLSTAGARRRFDERDAALIEDLAQRVAMAVDNARLHEGERRARAEAEAANQAKSDFLAVMSHELRTPLTAVVGYTELLADEVVGPVNETQRDHLLRVRASSEHLLMLIEDILSYARIEAGREQVHIEEFALTALLEQASAIVRPLAEKKGLDFVLAGDAPAVMRSDPQKVRQILINLLANAVKFTERGSVRLGARLAGSRVRFDVADTGPGIEAEHLEQVFDAFWQVDQRITRKTGGTGLGLSVARQLARLLGGDVIVRSGVGHGSVFTVDLPGASDGAS